MVSPIRTPVIQREAVGKGGGVAEQIGKSLESWICHAACSVPNHGKRDHCDFCDEEQDRCVMAQELAPLIEPLVNFYESYEGVPNLI
jgi:hypothetical protein